MKEELRWNKWEWAKNIKGINNSLNVSLREVKSNTKEAKINFFCKTSDQKEGVNQALMSRPRVSLGYLNLKVSSQSSTLVACMKSLTGTGKKQAIGLPVLRALPGLFSSSSSFPEILLPHSGSSLHLNFCFCLFSHLHPQSFPFTFFEFFKNFYWLIWAALGLHSVQGPSLVAVKLGGAGFSSLSCLLLLWSVGSGMPQLQELWWSGLIAQRHVGSSWTRAWSCVPWIRRQILYHWMTREVHPQSCLQIKGKETIPFSFSIEFITIVSFRDNCILVLKKRIPE